MVLPKKVVKPKAKKALGAATKATKILKKQSNPSIQLVKATKDSPATVKVGTPPPSKATKPKVAKPVKTTKEAKPKVKETKPKAAAAKPKNVKGIHVVHPTTGTVANVPMDCTVSFTQDGFLISTNNIKGAVFYPAAKKQ